MRLVKRSPWLASLGVLLAGVLVVGTARADVTTDDSGSIIIYPKVVADGTRDTLIQLSNRSNSTAFAHCFYVNTMGQCSVAQQSCRADVDCPAPETCVRGCAANNFDLVLTAQQPVLWRASTGRLSSMSPGPCRVGQACECVDAGGYQACPGLEIAPLNSAFVPPTGTDFEGELKCYQTTSDSMPLAANALKGTATLETIGSGQISEYNALAITANSLPVGGLDEDQDLHLNYPGGANSGEYNFCPANVLFTTHGEGSVDPFSNATISTEVTLVPCTEFLETEALVPPPVIVGFRGYNEHEQPLSVDGVRFDCYFNRRLADIGAGIFSPSGTGGDLWKIRVTPSSDTICLTGARRGLVCTADDDPNTGCPGFLTSPGGTSLGCRPAPGVLGVVEEFFSIAGQADGTAASNMHVEGQRTGFGDIITIPNLSQP